MLSVNVKIYSSELSAKFCRHFWKKKKIGCNILRTADLIKWALQLRGQGGGGGGGGGGSSWDTRLRTEIFSQEYTTRLN